MLLSFNANYSSQNPPPANHPVKNSTTSGKNEYEVAETLQTQPYPTLHGKKSANELYSWWFNAFPKNIHQLSLSQKGLLLKTQKKMAAPWAFSDVPRSPKSKAWTWRLHKHAPTGSGVDRLDLSGQTLFFGGG